MINDPYRWMEEDTPELRGWVLEQHERTMAQLSSLPARESIRQRLQELLRSNAMGSIARAGNRYFFIQRSEDQELAALYCQDEQHGPRDVSTDDGEIAVHPALTKSDGCKHA